MEAFSHGVMVRWCGELLLQQCRDGLGVFPDLEKAEGFERVSFGFAGRFQCPCEVVQMRAAAGNPAQCQGFEEILAAEGGKAAADENGVRKQVKLAEFPECIPDDDGACGDGFRLFRAHDGGEFRAAQKGLPRFDAVHVPGGDDDGGGAVRVQCLDDGKECGVFLFTDGGQQDGLPGVKFGRQELQQGGGDGGHGCGGGPVEFDVRHGLHSVAAEDLGETSGVRF